MSKQIPSAVQESRETLRHCADAHKEKFVHAIDVRTWQVLMLKFPEAGGYTREEYLALLQSEVEVAHALAEQVFNPALVT